MSAGAESMSFARACGSIDAQRAVNYALTRGGAVALNGRTKAYSRHSEFGEGGEANRTQARHPSGYIQRTRDEMPESV